ncbi:MAG TPA: hypothetical protein VMW24_15765 [Sedimentisphaerales bacterium]|nr:hypothetical protein [Sedimentisphaerales bacterium]
MPSRFSSASLFIADDIRGFAATTRKVMERILDEAGKKRLSGEEKPRFHGTGCACQAAVGHPATHIHLLEK